MLIVRAAGAALIASVLFSGVAAGLLSIESGDVTGQITAISAVALVAFTGGMLGVRDGVTRDGLGALLVASAIGIVAVIVGTSVRISGVALGVPVAAIAIYVIARSSWKLGDTGMFITLLGLGTGGGYVLDAALHENTGSYGDQGAVALVAVGIVLCSVAVSLLRQTRRSLRLMLAAACTLIALSLFSLAIDAGSVPLILAAAGAILWGAGWLGVGADLLRHEKRSA